MIQLNVDTNSLLGFSKLRPLPSDENEEQDNLLSTWKDFFWFIKNPNLNINLQINNEEDIISNINSGNPDYSLISHMMDKCLSSDNKINLCKNANNIAINKPPFCKLTLTEDITIKLEKAYCLTNGYVIENWKKYNCYKSRNIGDNSFDYRLNNWNELSGLVFKCNSLIIADNYIFSYFLAQFNNFSKLIDCFLPEAKESNFQLIILTSQFYKKRNSETRESLINIYSSIFNLLRNKGFKNIDLSIIKTKIDETHDRHIFSNYHIIKSGHSFNYFDNEENNALHQPTTIDIIPFVQRTDKNKEFTLHQYKSFLEYYNNLISTCTQENKKGSSNSRLFNIL